jgi:hypothetical protein
MTIQYSTAVLDARNDATRDEIGTAPTLKLFDLGGAAPANCAAADVGTVLVSIALPSTWLNASTGGLNSLAGTWSATGIAAGDADFFRIYQGATCHMQGTVGTSAADLILDNVAIDTDSIVVVNAWQMTG